jgi:leucyl aminopeptidase
MIPAVENSVSGSAYRPGDVLTSRKGLFVEIGNTDAEGRLVLADALAEADTENPALLFCLATLTGAARAATGMELPPFFTDDESLAADLMRQGTAEHDPVWRLPLWRSYETAVDSTIADINAPDYPLAGASPRFSSIGSSPDAKLGAFRHSGVDRSAQAWAAQGRGPTPSRCSR